MSNIHLNLFLIASVLASCGRLSFDGSFPSKKTQDEADSQDGAAVAKPELPPNGQVAPTSVPSPLPANEPAVQKQPPTLEEGDWLDPITMKIWRPVGPIKASSPPVGSECEPPTEVGSAEALKVAISHGLPVQECVWILKDFTFVLQPTKEAASCGAHPPYSPYICPRGDSPATCRRREASNRAIYEALLAQIKDEGQLMCVRISEVVK